MPIVCPSGFFSEREGLVSHDECVMCEPGFYCNEGKRFPCGDKGYNPLPGASNESACLPCPEKAFTGVDRATSRDECICFRGYYMNSTGVCDACVTGADCSSVGSELRSLKLKPGYWRPSAESADVRRCSDAGVLARGAFVNWSRAKASLMTYA